MGIKQKGDQHICGKSDPLLSATLSSMDKIPNTVECTLKTGFTVLICIYTDWLLLFD